MIEFSEELVTNIPSIDDQHRALVGYVNDLLSMGARAASNEEIEKTLLFLGNYVVLHFTEEEAMQAKFKYPNLDKHHEQHMLFIEDYQNIVNEFRISGPSQAFMLRLNRSVIKWISNHIQGADLSFAKYMKSKGFHAN